MLTAMPTAHSMPMNAFHFHSARITERGDIAELLT
jgi:hypothetical protein